MMGKNFFHNLVFHAFLALCRFRGWRKTAEIWQKSRFWPTWSWDRALGYESKKMRKVHLWGDWVSSKSQNSQPFSQKLHLKVFSPCHAKKMRKNFLHKKFLITRNISLIKFYISCFIKIFVSPTKKPGHPKNRFMCRFHPSPVLHVSTNCSYNFCSFYWRFGCISCWNVLKYYILVL